MKPCPGVPLKLVFSLFLLQNTNHCTKAILDNKDGEKKLKIEIFNGIKNTYRIINISFVEVHCYGRYETLVAFEHSIA